MNALRALDFATPWAVLAVLPLLGWLLWRRRRRPPALLHARAELPGAGPSRGRWRARIPTALRLLALTAGCLALMRPRAGARAETVRSDGISIDRRADNTAKCPYDYCRNNQWAVSRQTVPCRRDTRDNARYWNGFHGLYHFGEAKIPHASQEFFFTNYAWF